VNFTITASIYLSQATRLSVDFITYFTVIHTKTYTSHVSTWSKSISDKIAVKKRRTPSKIVLLGVKNHLTIIGKYLLYINAVQDEKRPQFTDFVTLANEKIELEKYIATTFFY